MGDYDSDDEQSQLDKLRYAKVPRGMHVSGWDDDADELIEEDKNPEGMFWQIHMNPESSIINAYTFQPHWSV